MIIQTKTFIIILIVSILYGYRWGTLYEQIRWNRFIKDRLIFFFPDGTSVGVLSEPQKLRITDINFSYVWSRLVLDYYYYYYKRIFPIVIRYMFRIPANKNTIRCWFRNFANENN